MLNNNCVSWVTTTSPEGHLDLDEGLVAVGQQVLGLARVDTHHAQQQVTARTQRHLHLQKLIKLVYYITGTTKLILLDSLLQEAEATLPRLVLQI